MTAADAPPATAAATPSVTPSAAPAAPTEAEVAKIVAGYRAYVAGQVDDLIAATEDLAAAIKRGSPVQARARYPESRRAWGSVRAFADGIDGLVAQVDAPFAVPGDLAAASKKWLVQSEAYAYEPFTAEAEGAGDGGWRRIEWSIYADKTIKYLSAVGDELLENLGQLRDRVPDMEITLTGMATDAAQLLGEFAEANMDGTAERYSDADISALAGNAAGARKIVELLAPVADRRVPGLSDEIRTSLDSLDTALKALELTEGAGYVRRDGNLTEAQRSAVADALAALKSVADPLAQLEGAVR